jgi:hypothetical protein
VCAFANTATTTCPMLMFIITSKTFNFYDSMMCAFARVCASCASSEERRSTLGCVGFCLLFRPQRNEHFNFFSHLSACLLFSAKCSFFFLAKKNTDRKQKTTLFFYSKNTTILNRLLFKDNNTKKKKRITTTRDDDACYCYYFCCDDERTDDD